MKLSSENNKNSRIHAPIKKKEAPIKIETFTPYLFRINIEAKLPGIYMRKYEKLHRLDPKTDKLYILPTKLVVVVHVQPSIPIDTSAIVKLMSITHRYL